MLQPKISETSISTPLVGMDEASQPNENFLYSNDSLRNSTTEYPSNVVVTSKYTPMNFVFLFLFESFKKLANAYFGCVALLQMSNFPVFNISSTNGVPVTLGPLSVVLMFYGVVQALEDQAWHQADAAANATTTLVYRGGEFFEEIWANIVVGDIVKVKSHKVMPADLLLLASKDQASSLLIPSAVISTLRSKWKIPKTHAPQITSTTSTASLKQMESLMLSTKRRSCSVGAFCGMWISRTASCCTLARFSGSICASKRRAQFHSFSGHQDYG